MQINILEIAQKLVDELLAQSENNKQRAEGVAMLFEALQEAHAQAMKSQEESAVVEAEASNVQG
jgi:hypothetical protein